GQQVVAVAGHDHALDRVEGGGDVGVGVDHIDLRASQHVCGDIQLDVVALFALDIDDQHVGNTVTRGFDVAKTIPQPDLYNGVGIFQAQDGGDGVAGVVADRGRTFQCFQDFSRGIRGVVLHLRLLLRA